MRLAWGPEQEAFRTELRAFLDEHAPPEEVTREGFRIDRVTGWVRDWQAKLFDHGWLVPGYPPELGGRNATPLETLIYMEEMAARNLPRSLNFQGVSIVAPSLLEVGTEDQKKLVAPTLRGDVIWCIGMSEPNAGSDLAGLQTRAELRGDHFVVNGQKVWTSSATFADLCFCYVRTDPAAPKHKGISVLIIDMRTAGVDARALRHLTGAADFAEVFFHDVVVPRENLVGELNDGWRVTMISLAHERAGLWVQGVAAAERTVDELVAAAKRHGTDGDPSVRRAIAAAYERVSSLRALGYKGFATFAQQSASPEHSLLKLASSELARDMNELGIHVLGAYGAVDEDPGHEGHAWGTTFLHSFAATIAAGTSEIQRNIIAERILGLPRGS